MGCGLHRTGEANRPYRCTFETECALCSHVRAQAKLLRIGGTLSLDYTIVAKIGSNFQLKIYLRLRGLLATVTVPRAGHDENSPQQDREPALRRHLA